MSFFARIERATVVERRALYGVPQLRDGLEGRISRETYLAYLAEAYHHVSQTVPLLTIARDRMDAAHARFRAALDEYVAEEGGHEQWILNDISRAGGDAAAVRNGAPRPPTARMIAFAHDCAGGHNPMGLFGMIYVLEGTSSALASRGAANVAEHLGLGRECFTYLTSHGALDQQHMEFFARLMDTVDDPDDEAAIVDAARGVYTMFADVFRAIPHDAGVDHAV